MSGMDISAVLRAVVRRWYVSLVVLALTAVAATGLWKAAEPSYTASTTLVVLPSPTLLAERAAADSGESSLGNPFGTQATTVLASLLADQINTGGIALAGDAAEATLAVQANDVRPEPYFTVVATGDSPEGTTAALVAAIEQGPVILAEMQRSAGAPANQIYTAVQTRQQTPVVIDYPDRLRMVLGVVLAGILSAALLSVLVDSLIEARRARGRHRDFAITDDVPAAEAQEGDTGSHGSAVQVAGRPAGS
ncbi:hypothetical protein O2W19_11220 [Modestobacter sp. VKM Ac-2980]|uniref:hypothetical protein n=2 Tax=unclassified Modestobacter TaxID=2643866 RepID=UPI0022AB9111|nr:hypothetical protein [Modestobacter sp. VKM Ac-2980]MCZ2842387.1 hypothetical protein [Modestobacter sp. VKM Ac-2980]